MEADQVAGLDTVSDYAWQNLPKAVPYVVVQPTSSLRIEDRQKWLPLNLPYRLNSIIVESGQLRLGAGVRLVFQDSGFLMIDRNSSIAVDGTPESPVYMSSESGMRGAWAGLLFNNGGATQSAIANLVLSDAGNAQTAFTEGAITVGARSNLRITDTEIKNGGQWGIACASGATVLLGTNLLLSDNLLGGIQPSCQS